MTCDLSGLDRDVAAARLVDQMERDCRAPDSALCRVCRGPLRIGALGIVGLLALALTWLARRGR